MKKIRKLFRTISLVFLIILASIIPFPIPVFNRDRSPKYIMEQVDKELEEDEEDEKK